MNQGVFFWRYIFSKFKSYEVVGVQGSYDVLRDVMRESKLQVSRRYEKREEICRVGGVRGKWSSFIEGGEMTRKRVYLVNQREIDSVQVFSVYFSFY